MPNPPIVTPKSPEKGSCEPDIEEEPYVLPQEVPESVPVGIPVEIPGIEVGAERIW